MNLLKGDYIKWRNLRNSKEQSLWHCFPEVRILGQMRSGNEDNLREMLRMVPITIETRMGWFIYVKKCIISQWGLIWDLGVLETREWDKRDTQLRLQKKGKWCMIFWITLEFIVTRDCIHPFELLTHDNSFIVRFPYSYCSFVVSWFEYPTCHMQTLNLSFSVYEKGLMFAPLPCFV